MQRDFGPGDIIGPVIEGILNGLEDILNSALVEVFFNILYLIIIQPLLKIIDVATSIIQYVSNEIFFDIIFGGKNNLSVSNIPIQFWGFCAAAIFIGMMIFMFQFMLITFQEDLAVKERIIKTTRNAGMAVIFTVLMPFGFLMFAIIMSWINEIILLIFNGDEGGIASAIYKMGFMYNEDWLKPVPPDFAKPESLNMQNYNVIVVLITCFLMLYTIFMLGMGVVSKVFEIFLYFIIGPVLAATMINDGGQRLKSWKDGLIGKMMSAIGAILGYMVFITIISIFLPFSIERFSNTTERTLLLLLLIVGGGMFTMMAPQIMAAFVGEGVGAAEGRGAMQAIGHAKGMAIAGATGLGTVLGLKKLTDNIGSNGIGSDNGDTPGEGNSRSAKDIRGKRPGIPGFIGKSMRGVSRGVSRTGGVISLVKTGGVAAVGGGVGAWAVNKLGVFKSNTVGATKVTKSKATQRIKVTNERNQQRENEIIDRVANGDTLNKRQQKIFDKSLNSANAIRATEKEAEIWKANAAERQILEESNGLKK